MEYYQNVMCVTYDDLVSVFPYNTIKDLCRANRCTVLRPGFGRDTYALISWASLPPKYQQKFIALVGDPYKLLEERDKQMRCEQRDDAEAVKFFSSFTYMLRGRKTLLNDKQRTEHIRNATALKLLLTEHNRRVALTKASNNTRNDLWKILLESSERLRAKYPHTLPRSESGLREKVLLYKDMGLTAVISGKLANSNTKKITEDGERLLVALRRSRVPVLSIAEILERYNEEARRAGWKEVKSERTLQLWFDKPENKTKWFDAVYGEQKAHQKFDRKHSTELPMERDQIWYGDGTKLNLYYRDEEGRIQTINVYEVMDAATEMLLGYHISETEDYDAQYRAYRMAVETSGHKPVEIVYDNQGGHKKLANQQFFSKLALRHRPTAPYNGSSKTIEHAFYRFQSGVLSKHFNFTGQNVTTKMDRSKPNIEFIEANKHALPTLEELKAQYAQARQEWNEGQHPKTGERRCDMYARQTNALCPEVTEYDMMDMFWVMTSRPSTYTANGLRVNIKGQEYLYEVYAEAGLPDFEWTSLHVDEKFYVQYDPMDMQSVRLISSEADEGQRRVVSVASQKMVVHRSSSEQTAEERKFIRDCREAVNQLRAERLAEAREIEVEFGVNPEQHGLVSPKPKNLPKDLQEQLEKRVARARRKKIEAEGLGAYTKSVSLQDWIDDEEGDSKDVRNIRAKY